MVRRYNRATSYLDVVERTGVLNSRLGVVSSLLDSLASQLSHDHASNLEVIKKKKNLVKETMNNQPPEPPSRENYRENTRPS
jgi:hypothetical protein